uniref:Uncharacterized protein n=1 Tax=Panagrolaimus davidi TaxID=227884 RepID=A0A914PSA9_9BILA
MENMKFEGRYYLSELFKKESEEAFAWIIFWFSMINFVLGCLTLVIIITQTPTSMKSFRNLLLALLSVQMIYEVFTIFYKPAVLLPLPIFIPINPIVGVTNALDSFGAYISMINMSLTMDLLLCMIIQRYFTMSNHVVSHPKHLEKCVYGMVFITNLIFLLLLVTANFNGDRLNEQDTLIFIQKHIYDWENLLLMVKHPAVITVFLRSDLFSRFEQVYTAFYGISRFLAFVLFTNRIMRLVIGTNETSQNRKQHQMIIKLLKFEFFAVLFLIIIPSNLMIYAIAVQIPNPMLPMYCALLIKLYPPLDMILTAFLIKPYRNFLKKVVCKICRLKSAKVSDISSTTPPNNIDGKSVATNTNRT